MEGKSETSFQEEDYPLSSPIISSSNPQIKPIKKKNLPIESAA
jgi:hypothetical protein